MFVGLCDQIGKVLFMWDGLLRVQDVNLNFVGSYFISDAL